jgi:integration host factor subunit alpha
MTITKADLMNAIYEKTELQRQKSVQFVESLTEIIKHTLESGEDVLISGFGKFSVRDKSKRKGRNPQTGEDAMLRERRVVTFKTSPALREKINSTKL